jgi:hypothetical protein
MNAEEFGEARGTDCEGGCGGQETTVVVGIYGRIILKWVLMELELFDWISGLFYRSNEISGFTYCGEFD